MGNLAVPEPNSQGKESENGKLEIPKDWPAEKIAAARLFASGQTPNQVMVTLGKTKRFRHDPRQAKKRVREWQREDKFLQVVWDLGVGKYAVQSPQVMGGLFKKARRGRVDAAKLFLELAGLYDPRPDAVAQANVQVVMNQLPRPAHNGSDAATEIREAALEDQELEGEYEEVDEG